MAKKGDWVRIHSIVLKAEERTAKLPDDTKKCDLQHEAPYYTHSYGKFVPEIIEIDRQLREIMNFGGEA